MGAKAVNQRTSCLADSSFTCVAMVHATVASQLIESERNNRVSRNDGNAQEKKNRRQMGRNETEWRWGSLWTAVLKTGLPMTLIGWSMRRDTATTLVSHHLR